MAVPSLSACRLGQDFYHVPTPFLIGVSGGTASGKSSVCSKIMTELGQNDMEQKQKQVIIISQESFYNPLSNEDKERACKGQYNFDHPSAVDDELLLSTLRNIQAGQSVQIPEYDFINHCRKPDAWKTVYPADVILLEGILIFYFKEIRDLFNMKLFVDTDADTRLSRRVVRDMQERERSLEQILRQYTNYVKPAFEEFCLPTKKYADVIIPRGADNTVAIGLIVQHIQDLLKPTSNLVNGSGRLRHNSDSLVDIHYEPPVRHSLVSNRPH